MGGEGERDSVAEEGGLTVIMTESGTNQFGLSYGTRIKGFAACFVGGFLFSLLGGMMLFFGNLRAFAIFYTMGSLVGIGSTLFLLGPWKQLQRMCATTRVVATIVMFAALVLTLMSALYWKKNGLTLIFIIVQFFAMTWYSLSYIPYARDAVKKFLNSMF